MWSQKQIRSYKKQIGSRKQIRSYKKQTNTNYANNIYDKTGDYSGDSTAWYLHELQKHFSPPRQSEI